MTEDTLKQFINANPTWVDYAVDIAVKRHGIPVEAVYQTATTLRINPRAVIVLNHTKGSASVLTDPWYLREKLLFHEELRQPLDWVFLKVWYDLIEKAVHIVLQQHIKSEFGDIDWADPESALNP